MSKSNEYVEKYGYAEIIYASRVYPDLTHACVLPPVDLDHLEVLVASEKEVKINAVQRLFEGNPRFVKCHLQITGMKSNSKIAEQPIGIANGRLGCVNRIQDVVDSLERSHQSTDKFICAIENYFEESGDLTPRDHAFVMIRSPQGQYFEAVSDGIRINRKVFLAATRNIPKYETGYAKTIGAYLEEEFGFNGSDWFQDVLPPGIVFSREEQILTTLSLGTWF
jgi:non-canonical (house-cleaning) NTP pyrophosphatase